MNTIEMGTFRSTPIASTYYQVKVGGDAAALKGIMKTIMDAADTNGDALDHDFIAEHTNGFAEVRAMVERRSKVLICLGGNFSIALPDIDLSY